MLVVSIKTTPLHQRSGGGGQNMENLMLPCYSAPKGTYLRSDMAK